MRSARCASAVLVAAALGAPSVGLAHVDDAGAAGFTVTESAHIAAAADQVYAALIVPSHWWSSEHTYSHDAGHLVLDARAGGCWCETLAGGGSAQHMMVLVALPGKALRLRGALGPLQPMAVNGVMSITLTPAADGTDLVMRYAVGGYAKDGLAAIATPVDSVLGEQVARLKRLIEQGSPEPAPRSQP